MCARHTTVTDLRELLASMVGEWRGRSRLCRMDVGACGLVTGMTRRRLESTFGPAMDGLAAIEAARR